jgi:ribosomal protein S18 acetylase RimI-like enzyme
MKITIRSAKAEDAPVLGHIQVTSWRSAFRKIASDTFLDHMVSEESQAEDWKEILAGKDPVIFIAELEEMPVGYAWAQREDDNSVEWDAELISLHILPEHKRQGIGRRLFAAAAAQLQERGCKSIYLWVLEENDPARKFYETLGGQLAGKQTIKLGDSELTEVAYGWKDLRELERTE